MTLEEAALSKASQCSSVLAQQSEMKQHYQWPDETKQAAIERFNANLVYVEQWLAHKSFVVGSRFTAADILYYHLLAWAQNEGISLSDCLLEYMHQLEARSAIPETMINKG